jgi:hypothetical protein
VLTQQRRGQLQSQQKWQDVSRSSQDKSNVRTKNETGKKALELM